MINKIKKLWIEYKDLYFSLVKNDFHSRYNGSAYGMIWGIVQPMVTIMVYWFVFQVGLRSGDRPDGTPYILWLICGMIPWFFISEALSATTNCFLEYSYLVKKVNFRLGLIPLIKIGSSLLMHIVFLLFAVAILNLYGYTVNLAYFQIPYYVLAACFLLVGVGLVVSSITVFFRDMSQIIGIVIQVGFWAIPIVWGSESLSGWFLIFFKLNPVYYVVEGYREMLISGEFFWIHPAQTLYFWTISMVLFIVGYKVFHKLKPNFADVL